MRSKAETDPYAGTQHLWSMPGLSNMTMRTKQLRAFLEATGGTAMARGRLWDIESKHLGAGVYRVRLKEKR